MGGLADSVLFDTCVLSEEVRMRVTGKLHEIVRVARLSVVVLMTDNIMYQQVICLVMSAAGVTKLQHYSVLQAIITTSFHCSLHTIPRRTQKCFCLF